jgi:hypothetical protein
MIEQVVFGIGVWEGDDLRLLVILYGGGCLMLILNTCWGRVSEC